MTDDKKVKADDYGDTVVKSLKDLWKKNELCDFKVSAGGHVYDVHKCLLAATSDFFRVMFSGAMAESEQNMVDLKAVTADGLRHVIEFIYTGEMALHYENLTEIIHTASHLQVHSALDLCSNFIKSVMTFENAEDFLNISETYSLNKVLIHWDQMIQRNFQDFSLTQTFLKMSAQTLINKHLSQNSLQIASEFKLFRCMEKWFRYNQTRLVDGQAILNHIRFPLMSQTELGSIQDNDIIRHTSQGLQCLAKGFRYHMDSKGGHPCIEITSDVRSCSPCLVLVHYGSSYMPFQITAYDKTSGTFYRLFSDVNGSRDCRVGTVDNFAYICRVVDFGGGSLMSSVFRFDPRHLIGQELRPMRRLRLDCALVSIGKYIYVFGGLTDQYAILDSVECYNVMTNLWEDVPSLPVATHSLAGTKYEDKIYLTGGVVQVGQELRNATNSFTVYHPVSRRYESKPGMLYARRLHDMITVDEKVYVLGGIPRTGTPLHGQIPIECYSHRSNQWTLLSNTLSGRSIGHYIHYDDKILSLGHEYQSATEDEVWSYKPHDEDWNKYVKAPQRLSLTQAMCIKLYVNFVDEKISKLVMK